MPWTSPKTWVVGAILTAAELNTNVRDNLNYLKGLLDGTGTDAVRFPPATVRFYNDTNFWLSMIAGNPFLAWDADDYLQYDRTNNHLNFHIATALKLRVDANGKLTGAGFFDSGEFSRAPGGAASKINHGLAARPRLVIGIQSTVSGVVGNDASASVISGITEYSTAAIYILDWNNTQITYNNGSASTTWYGRFFAML